jgi:hypothetical protein
LVPFFVIAFTTAPAELPHTLVALTHNLQGDGRVLLIEGTSMGATYGALNFFTNEKLWQPVIRAATDKTGELHNCEVLLNSDFVRGGTSNTHMAALHLHDGDSGNRLLNQ